jgi:hypothetical protein
MCFHIRRYLQSEGFDAVIHNYDIAFIQALKAVRQ